MLYGLVQETPPRRDSPHFYPCRPLRWWPALNAYWITVELPARPTACNALQRHPVQPTKGPRRGELVTRKIRRGLAGIAARLDHLFLWAT